MKVSKEIIGASEELTKVMLQRVDTPPTKLVLSAGPKSTKPRETRTRKAKPAAIKNEYRIEVNTTLVRRDEIERTAKAMGVSMSAYLLLCEERAVHQLIERFTSYLDTRALVAEEKMNKLISKLEVALGPNHNIPR